MWAKSALRSRTLLSQFSRIVGKHPLEKCEVITSLHCLIGRGRAVPRIWLSHKQKLECASGLSPSTKAAICVSPT